MADPDPTDVLVVEAHVHFTLTALCHATGAQAEQVHALVAEGVLEPAGQGPDDWRFSGPALPRARTALRLSRELGIDVPGTAVVMELLAEIERLRTRLRRLGVD